MNNNIDIKNLMNMLSKMSKEELDAGIAKANQILKNSNNNSKIEKSSKNK